MYIRVDSPTAAMTEGRKLIGLAVMPDQSYAIAVVADDDVRGSDTTLSAGEYTTLLSAIASAWAAQPEPPDPDDISDFKALRSDYIAWRNADINNWSTMTSAERADHLRAGVRLSLRANKWMFEYLQNLDIENAP